MVAPISTSTPQLSSARDGPRAEPNPRGWRHSSLAADARARPGAGRPSPVSTCSFHPRGHRGRLAWLRAPLPTPGSREGVAAPSHPGPRSLCPAALLPGQREGAPGGEARGPAAPSSLSLHRNVWGTGAAAASGLAGPAFPLLCHLPFL